MVRCCLYTVFLGAADVKERQSIIIEGATQVRRIGKTMEDEMNRNNGNGASGADGFDGNNGGNGGGDGASREGEAPKTYTAEEVAKLIQAEADRRTNQALEKQKRAYEKKLSLSSLDEQQRKEAEAQMKIQELQEQLELFQIEKNKSEIKSVLGARNLDVRFADIINVTDDLEASQKNIETLDALFKAAVKTEVEKRLAGSGGTPRGDGSGKPMTKEDFLKLPMHKMQELMDKNPDYYKNLLK